MKVLVTGAEGMLGQDLCPILEDNGYDVVETDIKTLDVTDFSLVSSVIKDENPDFVMHCAAYTNVDKAESDLENARLINSKGTENIAKVCANHSIPLVYISTDYVFDGSKKEPYKPSDIPNPVNNYGITKLEGENAVKKYCTQYYIVRTSWLYGHHGKNFVETMLSMKDKKVLTVVDDQIGCPTWTVDLSNGIMEILDKEYGIYHICGGGATTWYEFAKEIFKKSGVQVELKPCSTNEFPREAKRPEYSVMDNGGLCRDWKLALRDYLALRPEEGIFS